jgi:predicted RNA-binding protein YlqC (UPF0109 family)
MKEDNELKKLQKKKEELINLKKEQLKVEQTELEKEKLKVEIRLLEKETNPSKISKIAKNLQKASDKVKVSEETKGKIKKGFAAFQRFCNKYGD